MQYSTLGTQWVAFRGHTVNPVLTNPTLVAIAQAHKWDVANVVIQWAVRQGVAVVPASTNQLRQTSNLHSFNFELTTDQMVSINSLDGALNAVPPRAHRVQ